MQSEIRDNIVYVAGEVSVQTVNQAALAQFAQQCRQPEIHAIDLSQITRADSACLCLLLEILRGSGGQLRGIPAAVRDLADLYEVREWMNL